MPHQSCTFRCRKLDIFPSLLVSHFSWLPFAHLGLPSLRDISHKTCSTLLITPYHTFHLIIGFTICQPFLAFSHQAKLNCRIKARIVTIADLVKSFDITSDPSINQLSCHFSWKLSSFSFWHFGQPSLHILLSEPTASSITRLRISRACAIGVWSDLTLFPIPAENKVSSLPC